MTWFLAAWAAALPLLIALHHHGHKHRSDHMSEPVLNTEAAARVHYVDPRVRQLAYAAWHLQTGGTFTAWLTLGKNHPDTLIAEARGWMRAAVAAGIAPPPPPFDHPGATPTKESSR
ncbi:MULTISPECIES: hypothetical protein [unclassified Streptomyces]|uniref:hypothetical protein n=1 Tax=unclassified Streptomyces TaxID=2593676 RepID=UPI00226EA318|nr:MULTISPECIES: hypothetical protein [unclassified Streptomyces]MCY0921861.1 hypothetical protein [Streptomyces sp. H27-G5]MCY0957189.1 hypothetical protein [Streptomyces sp. H27-H5]